MFWLVASLLGLVVLVFLLVQLPFVQQRITGEIEKIARTTLNTDVGIGDISLRFPSRITVSDVYVNNPAGDSIARLGFLGMGINMYSLLSSTVEITDVEVTDVYANLITTDSSSNYQFLLDAFVPQIDTVTLANTARADSVAASGGGFVIMLDDATFDLKNADIYYQDDPLGILADVQASHLSAAINEVDLDSLRFDVDYLDLEKAVARIGIGPVTAPADTTVNAPTPTMTLLAGRVTVADSRLALEMPDLDLATELPYVNLEGAELVAGDQIFFNGELFQLRQFALRLDTPAPPLEGSGMDYNHLNLSQVEAEATDLLYVVDSLHLRLRQLSGREASGLEIQRTEGTVDYDPRFLGLRNFTLRTSNSELQSENTAVYYDFAGADMASLLARAQLDGYLGLRDVALLAPELGRVPVVGNNLGQRVTFSVRANGTMAAMDIGRLQVDGPGVRVRASGQASNLSDPDRLGGRLYLQEFSVTPGPLLPLIPADLLPPDIDWPQRIVAEGRAEYRDDRLELDLYAIENRTFGNGLMSRVRTSGMVQGLKTYPRTRLNVDLDTLLATRATILAYLPPGSLPEDYKIPDFVRGSGSVQGPLDNLDVNLRLNLPGENTFARINGNVRNVLDPDSLSLNLELSDLAVNVADVRAILPDSLLPANLSLPNLRVRNARISGSLTDLDFEVPLETDNGNWNLKGKYNPRDLNVTANVSGVNIAELFTGDLRDTLATLELGPLDIRAEVRGQLEPALDLTVDAFVGETDGDSLVQFAAVVGEGDYAAEFELLHPDFRATGEGSYALQPDSSVNVYALVDLAHVDLQQWDITEVPMTLEGELIARSEGLDPYNLESYARLSNVILRREDGSSFVDSLTLTASMHDWDNEVYVRSDVLDAELLGFFDPLKTPEKLVAFIIAYWDESLRQPDPVEDGDKLDFALRLKRPDILTGGLVPGLTELSPMSMSLLYRDASPELLFTLDLPELVYSGLEARQLKCQAIGDTVGLNFNADWQDVSYNNQFDLGRTVVSGETVEDELLLELKIYSEGDSLRHYLGVLVDQEGEQLTAQLEEDQILNFDTWTVPATNLISIAGPNLVIRDLILRHEEQSLAARTEEPGDVLVTFDQFNISTLSRLLFTEEEVAAGIVNGTVGLDNVMTNLGIQSNLRVDDLSWTGTVVGDLTAEVTSQDEQTYAVDVALSDQDNNANLTGTYRLNGSMDLDLEIERLQLRSAEPFSLGYLEEAKGYLAGDVAITGTALAPRMNGSVQFRNAEATISLLGGPFRLGTNPIDFNGQRIIFTNGLQILDTEGNYATVTGGLRLNTLTDIELDMLVTAEDFIAINSTRDDNPDYFGRMSVDARVVIGGTALLPVVEVEATTNEGSEITYVYRIPEEGLIEDAGIVNFEEEYEWQEVIRRDTLLEDTVYTERRGLDLTLDLDVDPNLRVTVVVDPITGQTFTGRADGNLTMKIYPDGRQEATGRIELVEGKYDFIYQFINKEFDVVSGSTVTFEGDLINPQLDLTIRHKVRTSSLPLVESMGNGTIDDAGTLRRKQTFYVVIGLTGDLIASNITTDIQYPEDAFGNLGLRPVEDALGTLRQDDSRITTTAFSLLAFGGFNIPLIDQGGGDGTSLANTTLNNALGGYLNNLASQYIGFVELDFGLDSYQDADGSTNTNLRVSLRKTLFNDRVVVSVDGVTSNDADDAAGTGQAYLDNITAEYLISDDGSFRLKFFNDRDRDILIGGNVLRYGGRITFSKDFDRLGWKRKPN